MAELRNRAVHYIFVLWFLLLLSSVFFFFPRLISAVADWMSLILLNMVHVLDLHSKFALGRHPTCDG